LEALE
jgi:hypothetical protein